MKTQGTRFLFFLLTALFIQTAIGQVNITVRVLPPYQSRITEYASRPDLMLLTVTNTTGRQQRVQLTASISGDNGVGAWVRPGYRSPQPLELAPGQALTLNGSDIAMLFDHNQIQYTGISQADFQRGVGLLEGTYQLCIRALDYDSHEPVSPEEPMGCTQFTISNVEPPTIIQPFNEQELRADGPQAFPITWSTPPGASPLTQYKVKLVEMIVPRNPNDAMQSATTPPFFEETVNNNMLLYGPQYPQLTPGRQYALMIQAVDPYHTVSFRNRGMSEVILFTYGSMASGATAGGESKAANPDAKTEVEYATNTITGKLSWAFKASEEKFGQRNRFELQAGQRLTVSTDGVVQKGVATNQTSAHIATNTSSLASYYLSHNPLQAARPSALAQADPTLNRFAVATIVNGSAVGAVAAITQPAAADIISSSGTNALAFGYESVTIDTGARRFPLANVVVTVKGIKPQTATRAAPSWVGSPAKTTVSLQQNMQHAGLRTSSTLVKMVSQGPLSQQAVQVVGQGALATNVRASGRPTENVHTATQETDPLATVLATARTDAEGNFTMQLLHPDYEGINPYERLVVSVNAPGMEAFEYTLPIERFADPRLDLGELTLLAKTYRFQPTITIEESQSGAVGNPGLRIRVFREADESNRYPHLAQEGMANSAGSSTSTINGKQYRLVAVDSVAAGGNPVKSFEFTMARLFYQGNLYIEIEGLSGNLVKKTTTLRIADTHVSPSRILVVKPGYESRLARPAVSGEVVLRAGDNIVPVGDAVISVSYNPEDVLLETGGTLISVSNTLNQHASVAAIAGIVGTQRSGTATFSTNAGVNPTYTAAAVAVNGLARPVQVSTAVNQAAIAGSSSFSYSKIELADGMLTEQALQNKYGRYTVKTDSTGQYRIGDLPVLKEGASYTVKVVSLPNNFRDMEVTPGKEQTFSAVRGSTETRSFSITPEVFNLVGRVVDLQELGVPYARLHFKGGSSYFESGEAGHFQTSYYAGKHTLIVEKEGYILKEIPIELGAKVETKGVLGKLRNVRTTKRVTAPGEEVMNMASPDQWIRSMQQTPTVQQAVQAGHSFTPALFGNAGNISVNELGAVNAPQLPGNLRSGPSDPFGENDLSGYHQQQIALQTVFSTQIATTFRMNELVIASTQTHDLGDIGPLLPRVGKVRFTIVDLETDQPIGGAQIQLFDTTQVVDTQGQWLYEGFGGRATVTVSPPAGSGHVPLQQAVDILESGEVTEVKLAIEKGIRVHGRVTSKAQAVVGAGITVEGRDFLATRSDEDGLYELYVSSGEQVLRAAKNGYFSKRESRVLAAGNDIQLDFELEDGGGRNISTLLGFEIELDKALPDGNSEKWTGRFVNLRPNAALFPGTAPQSLPFANIKVSFDAEGNAQPEGAEVITDVSSLPLKVLGFLPVTLEGNQQLKVVRNGDGKGSVSARIKLDVNKIQGGRGFKLPTSNPLFVALESATEVLDIEVFREGGIAGAPAVNLRFAGAANNTAEMDLYGFKLGLNLSASRIGTDGLKLVGTLNTPVLGPVSSIALQVESFSISKELRIQQVKIKSSDLPVLKIGGWEATLSNVLFNENGFKIGGRVKIVIPQSGDSNVEFANLSLGKDAIYGGQFTFPGNGINVYNIVKLTSGGKPLSFGRVGNLNVYSLGGSASMKFDKVITKEIKIPSFQIQTDGRFMLQAPVNYSAELAFAKFNIKNLTVSTLSGQTPFISVQGEFNVNFKGLKFEVADIRFTARANGGTDFSVGTIGGELAVPVMKVAVRVGLKDRGFEGGGALGIPGTPINAEVNFHYYKVDGGVDIGASFKSGIIIPIGIVEINNIGGGFSFNTANDKFMININGGASITGLSTAVNFEPISLTVTDGPVIIGEVGVKIASTFELVKAKVELNFPGKFFSINVDSDIEPIKGVARARLHGLLRLKWDPNESYVFLGVNTEVNVLGFFRSYGEYALGINIWDPKFRQDDIAGYFKYLDDDLYAQGDNYRFSGIYLHAKTEIGVPEERAVGIDLKIVSGKAWFHSYSDVMLLLNFAANDYRFRLAGGLSAGAEGCIGPGCIGASFSACYAFTGGFRDDWGWFLSGKAGGFFSAHIGKKCECNELCFIGGRICVGAHAFVRIRTRAGNQFSVGLKQDNEGNSCL